MAKFFSLDFLGYYMAKKNILSRYVECERTGEPSTFGCSQDLATFSCTLLWHLAGQKLAYCNVWKKYTAAQWIQTYKTANSTAYSTASTQPTAWVVIVFFIMILVSWRHIGIQWNHDTSLNNFNSESNSWLSHFVYRPWVWIPVIIQMKKSK